MPSLAFEIDHSTPSPGGEPPAIERHPMSRRRTPEPEGVMLDDEVAGTGAGPAVSRGAEAQGGAGPRFVERTLALGESSAPSPAAVAEAAPGRQEVSIPLVIPAGETREIVLRITIRPSR